MTTLKKDTMKNKVQVAGNKKINFHKGRATLVVKVIESKNDADAKLKHEDISDDATDKQEGIREEKEQREENHHPKRKSKMRRK
jgi:hypothetical protein